MAQEHIDWTWEQTETAFTRLVTDGRAKMATDPSITRLFALMTEAGDIVYSGDDWDSMTWTPGDFRGEEACIRALTGLGQTRVKCIVMLAGREHPLPNPVSWYFQQRLLETDTGNLDALILLWRGCGDRFGCKPLRVTCPPTMLKCFSEEK